MIGAVDGNGIRVQLGSCSVIFGRERLVRLGFDCCCLGLRQLARSAPVLVLTSDMVFEISGKLLLVLSQQ